MLRRGGKHRAHRRGRPEGRRDPPGRARDKRAIVGPLALVRDGDIVRIDAAGRQGRRDPPGPCIAEATM
jgi:hypothetical protein